MGLLSEWRTGDYPINRADPHAIRSGPPISATGATGSDLIRLHSEIRWDWSARFGNTGLVFLVHSLGQRPAGSGYDCETSQHDTDAVLCSDVNRRFRIGLSANRYYTTASRREGAGKAFI